MQLWPVCNAGTFFTGKDESITMSAGQSVGDPVLNQELTVGTINN